jgi:hypothetical protein
MSNGRKQRKNKNFKNIFLALVAPKYAAKQNHRKYNREIIIAIFFFKC